LYYFNAPESQYVVLEPLWVNLLVIMGIFIVCVTAGTWLFVKNERNR
jgi:hypothetical protein